MALLALKALPKLLWLGLGLILLFSLLIGYTSGLRYDGATSLAYYSSFFRIVSVTMGALLLGVLLARRALEAKARDLEERILAYARRHLGWRTIQWDDAAERDLRAAAAAGNPAIDAAELEAALTERRELAERSHRVAALGAAPLVGMAAVLAVAAWAMPAAEVFLTLSNPALNAALIHFVTYGSIFSIAGGLAFLPFHFRR